MSATTSRRARRSTVIRLSLAGLALVGIGAAATTAAWTDNVFFSAAASTSTFNLEGSTDGVTFAEGSDPASGVALQIPAERFANLTPGDVKSATVTVKNTGDLPATLAAPTAVGSGDIFDAASGVTLTIVNTGSSTLSANGGTTTFEITVTAPREWSTSYQGKTGAVAVTVAGASS